MNEIDFDELTDGVNPFRRDDWSGRLIAHDGVSDAEFTEDDVEEIIASGSSGDQWDGTVAAVFKLKDGRFVAYETFYGPTGSGFVEDAYGGDADIHFAADLATVVRMGMTDEGRRLCGIEQP